MIVSVSDHKRHQPTHSDLHRFIALARSPTVLVRCHRHAYSYIADRVPSAPCHRLCDAMKRGFQGGSRQVTSRLRTSQSASSGGDISLEGCGQLAHLLLEKRAWGAISSTFVQQIAAAAIADGATCTKLDRLSRIGNNGLTPGNCDRDLDPIVGIGLGLGLGLP